MVSSGRSIALAVPEATSHPSRWSGRERNCIRVRFHPESRSRQRGDSSARAGSRSRNPTCTPVVRSIQNCTDRSRVKVVLGQLSTVNLRDHAQRLTPSHWSAATRLRAGTGGHQTWMRSAVAGRREVTFRRIATNAFARATLVECVDDAGVPGARVSLEGLFFGIMCARFCR